MQGIGKDFSPAILSLATNLIHQPDELVGVSIQDLVGVPHLNAMIGVSQRVTIVSEYNERRDALDQRWSEFLAQSGLIPILIPNHPPTAQLVLDRIPLDGFLLTGGNNLVDLGGDAPERDSTEQLLLDHALTTGKPVIGVCRGMQFLQNHFGVKLEKVSGHVTPSHKIVGESFERIVNSFHQLGTRMTHQDLVVSARAEDGTVEAIEHIHLLLQGIMWHPERSTPFDEWDLDLFRKFFRPQGTSNSSRNHR